MMDWQQAVALSIVAGTAFMLLESKLRRRRFSFERDTHCGCQPARPASHNSIVFHARKGERPEVLVKMR